MSNSSSRPAREAAAEATLVPPAWCWSLSGKLTVPPASLSYSACWEERGTARRMPVSTMSWGHCSATVGTSLWLQLGHCVLAASILPPQAIEKLVALLNTLDRWIDETPPMDQPSRFGNKAFRTWYAKLDQVRLPQTGLGAGLEGAFRHIRITGSLLKWRFHLPKVRMHVAVFWE